MPDGYTAEAASPAPHMRRNVGLLIACQALFYTATGVILAVSALVGFALAPAGEKWLATAPQAIQWLTTAAFALPVALLMRRFGRKAIFVAFSLLGALGTLGATGAIVWHEFWVFVVATLAFGAFNAAGQHLRFAAAEVASDAFRAVAISLVVGGGVIGAFAGPEIAKWTHAIAADWLRHDGVAALVAWLGPADAAGGGAHPYQFAGTFLALVAVPLILIAVVALVRFPPPPAVAVQTEPAQPLLEMVVQPGFVVAVLCAVIGWGIMVFMMSATPLAMIAEHGHGTDHAMFVTQWHMVGMFAPSLVTGTLIRRHGLLNVLLCG
ncbi:MAG: MFS transporter, partial [Alphaproteobacteria bacterium]|nr:MFS transporter [Alphaproteobacteria bacterium]